MNSRENISWISISFLVFSGFKLWLYYAACDHIRTIISWDLHAQLQGHSEGDGWERPFKSALRKAVWTIFPAKNVAEFHDFALHIQNREIFRGLYPRTFAETPPPDAWTQAPVSAWLSSVPIVPVQRTTTAQLHLELTTFTRHQQPLSDDLGGQRSALDCLNYFTASHHEGVNFTRPFRAFVKTCVSRRTFVRCCRPKALEHSSRRHHNLFLFSAINWRNFYFRSLILTLFCSQFCCQIFRVVPRWCWSFILS